MGSITGCQAREDPRHSEARLAAIRLALVKAAGPERSLPRDPAGWPAGLPLRGPRLILRPFRKSDFSDVQDYAGDPEVTRHLRWGPNTPSETLCFVRRAIEATRTPDASHLDLALVERRSMRVRGGLGLHQREPGRVEIGYCLARAVWGLGYASEAVRSAVRFADIRFEGAELFGLVVPENVASERVLLRNGFEPAGDVSPYAPWMDGLCSTALAFRRCSSSRS